jgi:hypothetical protein
MRVARVQHTATLLSDGTVLVAGGFNGSGATNSSEIFNPKGGTWSPTKGATMTVARAGHTATLLCTLPCNNGKVLVAGGFNGSGATNSSEIYDPKTGSWSATKNAVGQVVSMRVARVDQTATFLSDNTVLVTGGDNCCTILNSSEVYDPKAGTWSATNGTMTVPRFVHTATLLGNGTVLVAGGGTTNFGGVATNSSEVYDPKAGTWSATKGAMTVARGEHTATLFRNGTVLVAGGSDTKSAETYIP